MNIFKLRRRSIGGAAGAPATLKTTEPAFNEVDSTLYLGVGDDGGGNATSIIPIAGSGALPVHMHAAATKATPVDADEINITDSAGSWSLKRLTFTNLKAFLKTYFDTVYAAVSHTHTFGSLTSKPTTLTGFGITDAVNTSQIGVANGVASLDGTGKVPASQLPAASVGGLSYQGTWNASTNTPAIPAAATGNKDFYYKVSVAGSTNIDGITSWSVGDWIISNGLTWDKIDNTDQVTSVAGRQGAVVLSNTDISGLGTLATQSGTFSGTSSGTNTGDQTITLTGDVTGSGTGSFAATVANDAITNAKLANVPTQTFKGRTTAATGDPEDLTVAQAKALLNLAGTNSGDQTITLTGDVTGSGTGSFAATLTNSAVTNAKLANMAPSTLKGNNSGSAGVALDLTVAQIKAMLAYANTDITGFGTMSVQNANAVAITGGTIDGITLDGGTF